MSLDDRMQSAFNERKESLETSMNPIKPLETSALPAGPTSAISTAIPWVAAAIAALAIVIAVVVLGSGGNNKNTVAADSPATTEDELTVASDDEADRKAKKSTEATTETDSDDVSDPDTEPEVESSPSLPFDEDGEPTVVTCTAPGYTVAVPVGWFHEACAPFSPAAIPAPGPFEFRPEINLSYDASETYAQALTRIDSTLTVLSSSTTTVDGHSATVFIIEEEWYDVGQQTLYVVDGGSSGVFFASGNELVDSNATFTDRAAHYKATLITLDAMLATVDVTYSSPVQKTQPVCVAPTFNNPTPGPSIQADVDGDTQLDDVKMVHHDAGASIVVEAGNNVFYVATFANAGIPHVSNDVIAVDLDADGVMEILASTHSGAAGNDYESFYLDGCDLTPIGGATPSLIQRATVTNVNSFECSFDAHGKVQLDTVESVYDNATSDYDHASETFQFDGTNWVSLVSNSSTSASPIQLTGPSTCG